MCLLNNIKSTRIKEVKNSSLVVELLQEQGSMSSIQISRMTKGTKLFIKAFEEERSLPVPRRFNRITYHKENGVCL
jgi:hypothetical protein